MSALLKRPRQSTVADTGEMLDVLTGMYDVLVELRRAPLASIVAVSTHADVRRTPGSISGPRVCIVTGRSAILDGGEAAYAWDATSTAADDDSNTIVVAGVATGRWRKCIL